MGEEVMHSMKVRNLRQLLCVGMLGIVLTGCSKYDKLDNTIDVEGSQSTEKVKNTETTQAATGKENGTTISENIETTLESGTEPDTGSVPVKEYLCEKNADYDGDGKDDKAYRIQEDYWYDYYLELSSAAELYLGRNYIYDKSGYDIVNADLDGDGSDEILFSVSHIAADNQGYTKIYAYKLNDGEYAEFELPRRNEGHGFVITRDLTWAQITCADTDFSYVMWSTLEDMQKVYQYYQGTWKSESTASFMYLTEYAGKPAICYNYIFSDIRYEALTIEEIVTYINGGEQTVEMYVKEDNDVTKMMRETYGDTGDEHVQYEYDMGADVLDRDIYNYIDGIGIDCPYILSIQAVEKDGEYMAQSMGISVGGLITDEEKCYDIMKLAQAAGEKFGIEN